MTLTYIDPNKLYDFILTKLRNDTKYGKIINPEGFIKHLLATGEKAREAAEDIVETNPFLDSVINPDLIERAGKLHDLGKTQQVEFHEVVGADMVLKEGRAIGLVNGSEEEIKKGLEYIADMMIPDFSIYEELGRERYPEGALYPKQLYGVLPGDSERVIDKFEYLRRELSKKEDPLTIKEMCLPYTPQEMILTWADMVGGNFYTVDERIQDIIDRYGDEESDYFNPMKVKATKMARGRIVYICDLVDYLRETSMMPYDARINMNPQGFEP